jgi:hypothetical protein
MFWDLNELHMVQNSSIYKEVIAHKDQAKKKFSAVKPVCLFILSMALFAILFIYFFLPLSTLFMRPFMLDS